MRELRLDDWPTAHEWSKNEDVYRYQVWGPNAPDETIEFVRIAVDESARTRRAQYFWAAEITSLEVIGVAELRVHDATSRRAEFSYIVHLDFWKRGHATRMARWVVDFAFTELGKVRVWAHVARQ